MKTYDVTIRAIITKTYRIEAEDGEDEDVVTEKANEVFSVIYEERVDENYKEELVSIVDVTDLIK